MGEKGAVKMSRFNELMNLLLEGGFLALGIYTAYCFFTGDEEQFWNMIIVLICIKFFAWITKPPKID